MRATQVSAAATIHAGTTSRASQPTEVLSNGNDPGRRKCRALLASLALLPTLVTAAPLVFEETTTIASPDPTYAFPLDVAVDGDTIIATGAKNIGEFTHYAAFLFQRQSNGAWVYVNTLAQTSCDTGEHAEDNCNAAVAMRNGLAVVAAGQVHVFRRSSAGNWIAEPSNGGSGPGDAAVGTETVLTSELYGCRYTANAFRKNASGVWSLAASLPGLELGGCDPWIDEGAAVDMSAGNRVIVANPEFKEVHIHEPNGTGWTQTAALTSPVNGDLFGSAVAIDDSRAFASGTHHIPVHVFNRTPGGWAHVANLQPPDSLQLGPAAIAARDLVAANFPRDPHRGGSVGLFRQTPSGQYEQVARLVGSDSASSQLFLGAPFDAYVNGSFARVVAGGGNRLYVFDLNTWGTTPAPQQEDFQQGNAANWTALAGSSFSVVSSSGSMVYRQSSVAGDAGSFLPGDWTNQAIEADVKPTAFNGADRWVGLSVRRTDANNNYYLTLRQSNVLELRRIVNGAYMTLASTPLTATLNRTYRLRLEAVGTLLRAYVDGRLALQVHDTALTHGQAGLRMYRASADFDNVIVSANPHLTLLDQRIFPPLERVWIAGPGTWSAAFTTHQSLVQTSTNGDARAVVKVDARNQIVQTRVKATAFASSSGVRWFGAMARYVDAGNYYYVTLRSDNTISLRKLVNGAIHILDTAPLTVSTGTAYTIRLEAIEDSLRVHVNGQLLLEATDTSHVTGKYGAVMYKAAATYEDFTAWEP